MQLEPLRQFICDDCTETISSPEAGWLEWRSPTKGETGIFPGLRIVHHAAHSPRRDQGSDCYYPVSLRGGDGHLHWYTGLDGLVRLLSMLGRSPRDAEAVVRVILRLHVPHFEETRRHFGQAMSDGFVGQITETWDYTQETLTRILAEYANEDE